MRLSLPSRTIDYLLMGIIAGVFAGIIVSGYFLGALETANAIKGNAAFAFKMPK